MRGNNSTRHMYSPRIRILPPEPMQLFIKRKRTQPVARAGRHGRAAKNDARGSSFANDDERGMVAVGIDTDRTGEGAEGGAPTAHVLQIALRLAADLERVLSCLFALRQSCSLSLLSRLT